MTDIQLSAAAREGEAEDGRPSSVLDRIFRAVERFHSECTALAFLPEHRYDRATFPTIGQYDWLAAQVLYCLLRESRPRFVIEFSTSSGYSTTFMAMALRRNGLGHIHTVDINAAAQNAAAKWFERNALSDFVTLHHGDCRRVVPRLLNNSVDLVFIDTLHSFDIACWYLERIVPRLRPDTLVHIHDVMPPEARVRIHGGPPYVPAPARPRPTPMQLLKRTVWRALHLQNPNPFPNRIPTEMLPLHSLEAYPPRLSGSQPTIDGNYFEEAVLLRELLRASDPSELVYLHRMIGRLAWLEPQRYAPYDRIGRTDEFGMPLEWNDVLWTTAGALAAEADRHSPRQLVRNLRAAYRVRSPAVPVAPVSGC